ncbi:hypothetical protein, partial [Lactobacillus sp.]|uniref:hypothetical protein n=1 Tax=Lactobacillus sp. TaxID=1591 RepID=UPI00258BEF86
MKYKTDPQEVKVWVVGDEVNPDAKNAIIVRHYLKDSNGNNTRITVPGMNDVKKGGRVGDTVKIKLSEHQAPTGYTMVPGQSDQEWTLTPDSGKEIIFYYTANELNNIKVEFIRIKDGTLYQTPVKTDIPNGHTNEILEINDNSDYIKGVMPKGYHLAKENDLTNLKDENGNSINLPVTQPSNITFDGVERTEKIYIVGDANSSITVNFVDVKTGQVVLSDRPQGKTGDELDLESCKNDGDYIYKKLQDLQVKNYKYASGNELKEGQKQPGKVTYGDPSVPVIKTVYVYKPEASARTITIKYVGAGGYTTDTTLQVREGQSYSI